MIEGLEKAISTPLDNFFNMVKLPSGFIFGPVLYHTPAQHCHVERCREMKLNCISSIIISLHNTLLFFGSFPAAINQSHGNIVKF